MVWLETYNAKTAICLESSLNSMAGCPSSLCCRHSSMHGVIFVVSMFYEKSIPMNCAISMLRNNRMQTYFSRPPFPKTPPRVFPWHQSDIEHIEHSTFSHGSVSISDKIGSLVPRGAYIQCLSNGVMTLCIKPSGCLLVKTYILHTFILRVDLFMLLWNTKLGKFIKVTFCLPRMKHFRMYENSIWFWHCTNTPVSLQNFVIITITECFL